MSLFRIAVRQLTGIHRSQLNQVCVRALSDTIVDPPANEPRIPNHFESGIPENAETKKARLIYQSRKRGMLENDLLLSTFASRFVKSFNDDQLQQYDFLINSPSNDWEIYYWITGLKATPGMFDNEVMRMLKNHVQNLNREKRIRQPDLD
ncbi:Succinate dehydrogenase assembly factor 2-B, mitochondrial [Halotydeus destructor]|nr:Succinate dehydrogenase assembly factor 2-B, mitochondrial [Halotydeus destructor]